MISHNTAVHRHPLRIYFCWTMWCPASVSHACYSRSLHTNVMKVSTPGVKHTTPYTQVERNIKAQIDGKPGSLGVSRNLLISENANSFPNMLATVVSQSARGTPLVGSSLTLKCSSPAIMPVSVSWKHRCPRRYSRHIFCVLQLQGRSHLYVPNGFTDTTARNGDYSTGVRETTLYLS